MPPLIPELRMTHSVSSCKYMSCCFSSLPRLRAAVIIMTTRLRSGGAFNLIPGLKTGSSLAVFKTNQFPHHLLPHITEQLGPLLILPLGGSG